MAKIGYLVKRSSNLKQVSGEYGTTVPIVEGERSAEGGNGDAGKSRLRNYLPQRLLRRADGLGEVRVQQQIG